MKSIYSEQPHFYYVDSVIVRFTAFTFPHTYLFTYIYISIDEFYILMHFKVNWFQGNDSNMF